MEYKYLSNILWVALTILGLGSVYLIVLGYKVNHLFADSIVGKLVKALVVVFLIELYSLGIVCFVLIKFSPKAVVVLLPIVLLWILSLGFAIFAIRLAKSDMVKLIK
jgi:hypothetical protein